MRISTSMIFDSTAGAMGQQQSNLLNTQLQLDSGKRINTPADDPTGAAQIIGLSQAVSLNDQYGSNRTAAESSLQQEDSALASVTNMIQHIQSQIATAGNATLNDQDRASIVSDLQSSYQQLLGLANTQDSNGQYVFAGYQGATQAFVDNSVSGAMYAGDQGARQVQVTATRQIALGDNGSDIFTRVISGMAGSVVGGSATNTGTATISTPSVVDATNNFNNDNFQISFQINTAAVPPTYQYTVSDLTNPAANPPVVTTYTPSTSPGTPLNIAVAGQQVTLNGSPANGDTFTVQPAANAGANVFNSLKNLITALQAPVSGSTGQATLTNALTTAGQKFSNALTNVLTVRASVGSRLSELTTLDSQGSTVDLQYQSQLSQVQDLDYASAISTFYQQQDSLQASQQAFVQVQKLSLFSLL